MSSGTRPNPLSQVLVDRGVRLAAGLAVVIAIPVAILFYFQFRSLNDLEATSAVVLRQLSSDTADSLGKSIEEALKRPHISVLLGIPQSRMEPPDPAFIAPVLTQGLAESPFIDEFYIWSADEAAGGLSGRSNPRTPQGLETKQGALSMADRAIPLLAGCLPLWACTARCPTACASCTRSSARRGSGSCCSGRSPASR